MSGGNKRIRLNESGDSADSGTARNGSEQLPLSARFAALMAGGNQSSSSRFAPHVQQADDSSEEGLRRRYAAVITVSISIHSSTNLNS